MATETQLVLCTCPDEATALSLATSLVKQGLAACVNRLPGVQSVYIWEEELKNDTEVLLLIKTTTGQWDGLVAAITAEHPYELPEIIAVPITMGFAPYLAWIRERAC